MVDLDAFITYVVDFYGKSRQICTNFDWSYWIFKQNRYPRIKSTILFEKNLLAILCDLFGMVKWPFQSLSDLQLGDKKVTLNHLADISLLESNSRILGLEEVVVLLVAKKSCFYWTVFLVLYLSAYQTKAPSNGVQTPNENVFKDKDKHQSIPLASIPLRHCSPRAKNEAKLIELYWIQRTLRVMSPVTINLGSKTTSTSRFPEM